MQIVEGPNAGLGVGSWRVWTSRDDIYVTTLHLARTIKVSLHASGKWRVAYTDEHMAGPYPLWGKDRDRAVRKFPAPPFVDGVQEAFVIAVLRNALRPQQPHGTDSIIPIEDRWDRLTRATIKVTEPGISSPPADSLIYDEPLVLASGNKVWLSAITDRLLAAEPERIPDEQMMRVLTPEEDGATMPGVLVCGVNVQR